MHISLLLHSITRYTMARGNTGLIQPYMFEPETDSEEELYRHFYKSMISLWLDYFSQQLIMFC